MPPTHIVSVASNQDLYHVIKNGVERLAHVLQHAENDVYVHYLNTDKRMDEWVPIENCHRITPAPAPAAVSVVNGNTHTTDADTLLDHSTEPKKRKRGRPPTRGRRGSGMQPQRSRSEMHPPETLPDASGSAGVSAFSGEGGAGVYEAGVVSGDGIGAKNGTMEILMTEEDYDIQHHKQITAQRNFDKVHFGEWQVKTWYFSPYPLTDTEEDLAVVSTSGTQQPKIPGVQKTTARSHGRTSDLLAGGLGRSFAGPEKAMLWVCQQCFKYMADGASYDLHVRHCKINSPPGEVVYHKGAHVIWEVDGAKNKLYCQNLSLFGKLFIDVKTLFFDCDNFLFYILTDADGSQHDHIIGFFSKEKVSYDDYNLACIMTLPPYQRKGYGMLMIEFSYELSRRAGKVGTPERPLSDLGLRSYLSYWVSTLIRFFRRVLSVFPPDTPTITTVNNFPDLLRSPSGDSDDSNWNGSMPNGTSVNGSTVAKKRKKTKGWAGEAVDANADPDNVMVPLDEPMFTSERVFDTEMNEDGAAVTHVSVRCTLTHIAKATNLRVEDAAFALNEVGMLAQRLGEVDGGETVVITRRLVEQVAAERNVKKPCMFPAYVRLP